MQMCDANAPTNAAEMRFALICVGVPLISVLNFDLCRVSISPSSPVDAPSSSASVCSSVTESSGKRDAGVSRLGGGALK